MLRIFAQSRSSILTDDYCHNCREGHMKGKVRIYVHVCMFVSRSKFRIIKGRGFLSHEIGPLEKFDLFHVKLSHMVTESDFS